MRTYSSKTYAAEAVKRIEQVFGCVSKETTATPVKECHPEMDNSPLLELDDHRKFQMLLGMLQWLVTIGHPDLCHLVSSLNRFGACPRQFHLDLVIRAFGYIKWHLNTEIAINSRPMDYRRIDTDYCILLPDFLEDYPHTELDPSFPSPFGPVLQTSILVDSDHGHDKKTRRSLTGLLAFVCSMPVHWLSKCHGSIASSTYTAEFSALRTATEEAIALPYMLRCLGCNLPANGDAPMCIFGDNMSVIQIASNPQADHCL